MEKIWLKNYPEGVPHEINPDQYKNMLDVFHQACAEFSEQTAFSNMGGRLSYGELNQLTDDFASYLQHHCHLEKGDRIAIQLPNVLQFPIALFGALKAGLTVVNTNPLYTDREMKHQFNDSGAKAIVILANFADKLEHILGETTIEHVVVTQLGDQLGWPKSLLVNAVVKYLKKMVPSYNLPEAMSFYEALDIGAGRPHSPVDSDPEDLAFLQYTGGTTGVSKGAMLTHKNITSNMQQIRAVLAPFLESGKEIVITPLPLYHIFSLTVNCLALMSYGAENVLITNPRDIPDFIKTLKKQPFTLITGVNTLFNGLMNHPDFKTVDFSTLKFSVAGGMALQQAVAEKWFEVTGTKVIEGFGLTETSPVAAVNPLDGTDKVGSIGLPVPSTEIKMVDENNREVPMGEPGELCIKGPQVMKGYWLRDDETANVMLGDGWLKTGDIAVIDDKGFIKIVDRKKDMILVSGFNVYPNEIEDVVAKHEQVLEVAAVGVPDEKSGEAVKLFVVKKIPSLTEDELRDFCNKSFVAYKRPKFIEFRSELPKTNVGKILRRALREGQ
ncbi:MAG: AMP-binding protein [Pseudobdellovibrionaceae bacterium]|nr:AMP-binding protein [Bdellovibrionales bacterium]USN48790.1 MAG: AMP-binding protein [Pseudobdellovibrionaceae bacterium]